MKPIQPAPRPVFRSLGVLLAALAPCAILASEAPAEGTHQEAMPSDSKVFHPWAGGVDPRPFIQSVAPGDEEGQLLLRWGGLSGPYKVQQRDNVVSGDWTSVGDLTTDNSMAVPLGEGTGIFRVEGQSAVYLSESTCRGCHPSAHNGVKDTAHAHAMATLTRIGQGDNPGCLPCHTVGFGIQGGFVSNQATPLLANVQCENCHGPGGNHVADPGDPTVRPVISQAGTMCGGCHTDAHHPTYDEWLGARHSFVDEHVAEGFLNPDVEAGAARMRACGSCHSGAVRLAMLNGAERGIELPEMPSGDHAAHTAITCVVCHTPHEKTPNGRQLRNPPYSMDFFSYSTSTLSNFTRQYNEDINICGQCHNQRGAQWQDTSRPPHHSPQYNVLIGDAGFVIGTPGQSSHRNIAKQCTHCHTHRHDPEVVTEEDPVYTGHEFMPFPENCVPCHTTEEAEAFISFTQRNTKALITEIKTLLDTWAESKSPEPLRTQYGKLAWEYQNVGQLSLPEDGSTVRGPSSAEQSVVPDEIKQARFFLYMVEHDGSYGVHNGQYARSILGEAKKLVEAQLAAD